MGKRLKTCRRMKVSRMDWISELPDEILIHILSFLTLKEAGRTSLLSKRWTGLWAYVPTLNFDSSYILYNLKHGLASITKEERKYFSWVDRVLSSYKAPIIDELRIRFDFQDIRKNNIENWLRFAMQKKVKRLQLDTTPYDATFRDVRFTFPSSSLCNSITSLELSYVDLSGEVLKKLLYDCHNLEYVSVEESYTLVDLEVSGPLNLKSLRIVCCDNMKHLEISAPNLISFEYFGDILSLAFKSTPKLAVVSIAGSYAPHLMRNGLDLSSCNSQIEVLKLGVYIHGKPNCIPKVFSVFPRLKVLDLTVHTHLEEDLFRLFRLIKACPFLQKLTFKLNITSDEIRRSSRKSRRRRKAEALCHDHLKIAIIDGFVADEVVSEFVMCLIDGAVSLKKITIVPTVISTRLECCVKHGRRKALSRARERARELVENLRGGIEVEIH